MYSQSIWQRAYTEVNLPKKWFVWLLIAFVLAASFPSDMSAYSAHPQRPHAGAVVHFTEDYGRFINTAIQIALPLVMRDGVGMVQLIYTAISTTLATHTLKRLLTNKKAFDTRLGQRPYSTNSKWNMPSGHSSMASTAFYFVCRRYGWKFAFILAPIMLLTMYSRVMLDQHTVSAVIAGVLIGIIATMPFTSLYRKK